MNIFVAKLSSKTNVDSLTQHFAQYGEVKAARIIKDRDTGESKCYGFVEMNNDEEGKKAIAELNDSSLDNRHIIVKISEPKTAVAR